MSITIREVGRDEVEALIPLLLLAEPAEGALRWGLTNLADALYRMDDGGVLVAAATMQWRGPECEVLELAVVPERQGQGLGRRLLAWLADEARRRGKRTLLVGTPNSNLASIAFYQRCGLRMAHIRHDYFAYYERYYGGPHYENGIQARDMLVFQLEL